MARNIEDSQADRRARALAEATDEALTKAVAATPSVADEIKQIARRCASLPVFDDRGADEILDYDDHGVTT